MRTSQNYFGQLVGTLFTAHAPYLRNPTSGLKSACRFGLSTVDFL